MPLRPQPNEPAGRRRVTSIVATTLATGITLALLSGCAARPQDSNTKNGVTPGPPMPSGVELPPYYPLNVDQTPTGSPTESPTP